MAESNEVRRRDLREPKRKKRKKLRFTTVIGELFILSGLAIFGYIIWQPWHTGTTVQHQQDELSEELSISWQVPDEVEPSESSTNRGEVPIVAKQQENDSFAVLYVPAFGKGFSNVIAEGTSDWGTLHPSDKGIGRYTSTQQFGELGNVGLAAHRSGPFISPFRNINNLRVGDPLFVETKDGWYVYRYRSTEYVYPDQSEVLDAFPRLDSAQVTDRVLTLTSCHPREWSTAERVIAYSVFEEFVPRADGPPAELLELNPYYASHRG